jgi:3',5'-cyclic AMP phosphodiesterase CpdA
VLIAQITDRHIRRKGDLLHHMIRTGRELRRAVEVLNALAPRPAFVVATGDLVDRGKTKEYRRLRKILAELELPVYLVPGNHDDRDGLRETFPDHAYLPRKGPLDYVVESRPVRLIALDTTRRHRKPGGEFDDERLAWLDERLLEAPAVPTLVAMHHPPFDVGIPPVDRNPFRNRDKLEAIIAAHPQVARIICGHIHRAVDRPFGNTIASTAPSTSQQLVLDHAERGYAVRIEQPAFTLHRWTGRNLVASVIRTNEGPVRLRAVS